VSNYLIRSFLVILVYFGQGIILKFIINDITLMHLGVGAAICITSNIIVSVLLAYRKKSAHNKIEKINKNIRSGVWKRTIINL